jgi:hypothetical protein
MAAFNFLIAKILKSQDRYVFIVFVIEWI